MTRSPRGDWLVPRGPHRSPPPCARRVPPCAHRFRPALLGYVPSQPSVVRVGPAAARRATADEPSAEGVQEDENGSRSDAGAARRAGRAAAERGRDARRGGRPRPSRGQPAGSAVVRDGHGIALWPHTKTHKSPEIGLRQLELGAGGLTVAKTGEARGLPGGRSAAHPRALPAVRRRQVGAPGADRGRGRRADGRRRRPRPGRGPLGRARSGAARRRRCWSSWTSGCTARARRRLPARSRSPQALSRLPAVEVAGISCYPGHCRGDADDGARARRRRSTSCCARRATPSPPRAFAAIASRAARRPTRYLTHETCVNELRSGTYALLDRVDGALDDVRATVEVTVVSDAVPGQIVIDAGSKTLTSDTHPDGGHGAIVGLPGRRPAHDQRGARLRRRLRRWSERPAVGDRLQRRSRTTPAAA